MSLLTKQEILTMLPDNIGKEISPSDIREIVHYKNVYGGLVSSKTGSLPQDISPSAVIKLGQWEFDLPSNGIVSSSGDSSLTILSNGIYNISAQIGFSSSNNTIYTMGLYKNDNILHPRLFSSVKFTAGITTEALQIRAIVNAVSGDAFSLYISHDNISTISFNTEWGQFIVYRLQ